MIVDPRTLAAPYLHRVRAAVAGLPPIRLVGLLSREAQGSEVYAGYAARGCEEVGIHFDLRHVAPEAVSREVFLAGEDPDVHGIIVFYPVFGGVRDRSLQNELPFEKDVEGLHAAWSRHLYNDVRYVEGRKAILPCTPLGILKALRELGVTRAAPTPARESAAGLTVTIFNRSEVVGRPLAAMLAHDGALVHSFDIDGVVRYEGLEVQPSTISRAEALAQSDVVVSGVPSRDFERIRADEVRAEATVIDFSHVRNVELDVADKARYLLRRVGPLTIAMLLRNTVRLYRNFAGEDVEADEV
ncbi:MAG: bifunctional methylenetetrahydrofolate dehydrogenase/methenyltetrahydrofolate cyclohydrolase [Planctomycetota bacterium]